MNCCSSQTNLVSFRGSQQPASVMCARYSIVRIGTHCAVFANTVRTATICCYHKKLLIHAIISVRTVVVLCRTLILCGLQQQHTNTQRTATTTYGFNIVQTSTTSKILCGLQQQYTILRAATCS